MDEVKSVTTFPLLDRATGAEAFARIEPLVRESTGSEALRVNVNVQEAAIAALSVARLLEQPEVRRRLGALGPEVFDQRSLAILRDAAWAAWHTKEQVMNLLANRRRARVEGELIKQAQEVRGRMLRTVSYYLSDQPGKVAIISDIRGFGGYKDVASDLNRLADIYEGHREILSHDVKAYSAADVGAARRLATQIVDQLSANTRERHYWITMHRRCWRLLAQTYEEVRSAALFVFREDVDMVQSFPSLVGATRKEKAAGPGTPELGPANPGGDPAAA